MAIKSETRLGPYEIVSAIGAGGMGEVYRARDPRLKREVAIKVLPASFSSDPQRLHRFEQEAIAAGALNHPNILAVYDIGQQDGSPYIVSELLDGATLRERLRSSPLPVRKAVDYGQQIASGLAAAHDKGIVHRDLKPDNIFITNDGRVKILDFGLAKLTRSEGSEEADALTQTVQSDPGTVLGTVGYMSPEQVRGKPADARSDLFSFGAILYEMLSGKRAFHGESPAETMSAILKEEPPELTETNRNVPPALERIVHHCLEKNPTERFQSARDVAFDLESVTAISTTSTTMPIKARYRRLTAVVLGTLALLVVAGAMAWRVWVPSTAAQPEFRRLTFRRGSIRMARFAPDGQTIYYGAAWDGKPVELFTMQYETSDSRPLGVAAQMLSISKTGEVALLLNSKVWNFVQTGTLAVMPLSGGAPRELLDGVQFAEWSPDSGAMAIVRFSMASGLSWIEYPAGKIIYRGDPAWIGHLRISPNGNFLAFEQHLHNGDDGYVVITDRDGNKKFASQVFTSLQGLAWRPDGKEVWFTAAPRGSARAIYAINMLGKQRLALRAPGALVLHDIASNGRVLLTNDNARKQMFALVQSDNKERNVSWLDWSVLQALSGDGKQVLFTEGGEAQQKYGLYLRRLDGLPKRIVDGYWGDLSPDGKWVVAQDTGTPAQFVLVPTGIGESRQITHDNLTHLYPRFLPDGQAIVFVASTPQGAVRMYYQALAGGDATPITPEGSGAYPGLLTVSADGRYVIAPIPGSDSYAMYPVHGGQPQPIKGLSTSEAVVNWSADSKYLFTYTRGEVPARIYRVEITSGKRELVKVTSPPDLAGVEDVTNLGITRDGRLYAYTCPTILSDLYVVTGLK